MVIGFLPQCGLGGLNGVDHHLAPRIGMVETETKMLNSGASRGAGCQPGIGCRRYTVAHHYGPAISVDGQGKGVLVAGADPTAVGYCHGGDSRRLLFGCGCLT